MAITRNIGQGSGEGRGVEGRGRGVVLGATQPDVNDQPPAWVQQLQNTMDSLLQRVGTLEQQNHTPAPTGQGEAPRVEDVVPPPPAGQTTFMTQAQQLALQETWMRMAERFQKMNPPTFSGSADPLEADKWIDDMKVLLKFLKTDQIQSRRLAAICLKGDANKWWQKVHTEEEEATLTLDEFVQRFEKQYIAEVVRANKEEELNHVRQGSMTITEYENRFISLLHFAKDLHLSDSAQARRFERGLNEEFRMHVKSLMKGTLKEVADAARAIEGDVNAARKRREEGRLKRNANEMTKDKKDNQGKQGNGKYVKFDPEYKRQRMQKGECFRCGEQGHRIRDCPKEREQENGANRQGGAQGGQVNALIGAQGAQEDAVIGENVIQIGGNRYAYMPGLPRRDN